MKKNNQVRLDGILKALKIAKQEDNLSVALATVVTLHPRDGVSSSELPSALYENVEHNVQIIDKSASGRRLAALSSDFSSLSASKELFACSLDGFLYCDGRDSYVVCDVADIKRTEKVRTSANNSVSLAGSVVSTSFSGESASIRLKTDEGVIDTFIVRKDSQAFWEMVSSGKVKRNDIVSVSGPLLSGKMTDGDRTINTCMVCPHVLQMQRLDKKINRKSGATLG